MRLHSLEHVDGGEEQEQDGQQQQLEQLEGGNERGGRRCFCASVSPAVRDGEEVQLADVFTGFFSLRVSFKVVSELRRKLLRKPAAATSVVWKYVVYFYIFLSRIVLLSLLAGAL